MGILEVHGMVKYYGSRKVVDGVSFDVDVGEVVGLLGTNGAGKTTSFRMATGQVTPNAGRVLFNGKDVTALPMYKRAREGMGYLAQDTSVFRKLTVEQNILAILEAMPVYRSLNRRLSKAERYQKTDEVLAKFGLTHLKNNNAARLSGGEKRRLEIARCLVCDPLLILLDEPFTGIDPQTIEDIQKIVRDLRDQGIGILVTDHRVAEVLDITDRSYLIKAGKVRTHGTPQELLNDPIAKNEYFGNTLAGRYVGQQPSGRAVDASMAAPPPPLKQVMEQETIRRLIDMLRTPEQSRATAQLLAIGDAAVPSLLEALERRDVEIRRQACDLLRRLLPDGIAFDPYAPESQRRQQLSAVRERRERRAS